MIIWSQKMRKKKKKEEKMIDLNYSSSNNKDIGEIKNIKIKKLCLLFQILQEVLENC